LPSRTQKKEEARAYIVNIIKEEGAYRLAGQKARAIYDEDIKTKRLLLNEIAEKYNLVLGESDLVTRFDYIAGLGESYGVIEEAFGMRVGEISKPLMVRKGYAFIQPVEFAPVDEKKFESEKENYREKILAIKKMKALEEWAREARKDTALEVNLGRI